ncbi:CD82 antigen-like [Tubulanus polymorphus]|uniref:CD82 antigen-like n=1 Tax=Tubulanus polymorphus TaxID=672921 RepID=UPI003DA2BF71
MAVGCGAKCAKILLIVFNFVFWLSGAAILGVGIWLRVDPGILQYLNIIQTEDQYLSLASYILIGLGCFVFIVGFFGCCGAIKESRCMLGMYIFFLVIVMGGEIAAGALVIIYKAKVTKGLKTEMEKQVKEKIFPGNALLNAWNYAQIEFKCCGAVGITDYDQSAWQNNQTNGIKLPKSCCVLKATSTDWKNPVPKDANACQKNMDANNVHQKGCFEQMSKWFQKHSIILIAVACGVAGIELFGFVFAICLCRNIGVEA